MSNLFIWLYLFILYIIRLLSTKHAKRIYLSHHSFNHEGVAIHFSFPSFGGAADYEYPPDSRRSKTVDNRAEEENKK